MSSTEKKIISTNIKNYLPFLKRRLIRIEPPYLASIILVLVLNYFSHLITGLNNIVEWENVLFHIAYLNNFNLGRLLKQDSTIGKVTVKAAVVGTGLDPKKINASFDATVLSAVYNNYNSPTGIFNPSIKYFRKKDKRFSPGKRKISCQHEP